METGQIKILLERYFEGQTDLQEEQLLQDYFSADVTDLELLPFRQQFLLIRAVREQESSGYPEFEARLAGLIDSQHQEPVSGLPAGRQISILRRLPIMKMAAAAAIITMIGISGLLLVQKDRHRTRDTYSDPQQAYNEAQKTMLYVAHRMNSGIEPLSAVSKINAGNEHLKSLKKLNNSLDMLNMVSFINNSSNLKK